MGRFEIAKNDKEIAPAMSEKPRQGPPIIRALDLIKRRDNERLMYSSPVSYPLEDHEVVSEQTHPSRNLIVQWPMGHRTILPFRNLTLSVSDEGIVAFQVPMNEARRIVQDIEQAHRRYDPPGTASLGPR